MNKRKITMTLALMAFLTVAGSGSNTKSVKADSLSQSTEVQTGTTLVKKITGASSFEIAVSASKAGWDKSDAVIIVDGSDFADALAGTSLGIQLDAPILYAAKDDNLGKKNVYDSYTAMQIQEAIDGYNAKDKSEIARLGAKKAYIIGGAGSVTEYAQRSILVDGIEYTRLQGKDRFETAVAVGKEIINKSKSDTVFLCNAYGFADALAGSTYAGRSGSPILLTEKDKLNAVTRQVLIDWKTKNICILGGVGVVSEGVENELKDMGISITRIGGTNRYDTAQNIINKFDPTLNQFTLASGKDYHNALVASVYGNKIKHPVILMDNDCTIETKNFVKDKDFVMVGNEVSEEVIRNPVTVSYYTKDRMTFSTLNDMPVLTEKEASVYGKGTLRYSYYQRHMENWICPKIKSTATDDIEKNFEILDEELGFGHGKSFAAYNLFDEHADTTMNSVICITNETVLGKYNDRNAQISMIFDAWDGSYEIPGNYRIKPIAKQLFKFYFPTGYETLYNIVDKGDDSALNKIYTLDNREVKLTVPANKGCLYIWVSAPGEHLSSK